MSQGAALRSAEIGAKLAGMRAWLARCGAGALRLRGSDWFAWATAGASNAVLLTAETGVAEVLVSPSQAWVLTDTIERLRLCEEELDGVYALEAHPWAEPQRRERFILEVAGGAAVLSDRPQPSEQPLPQEAQRARLVLCAAELQRYRELGALAAQAMSETLLAAEPGWTEWALAGAGARALWARGIHPALVLAAGERRLARYRHPTPSGERIGGQAMLVFCARRHGLYANLTRFVAFGAADPRQDAIAQVEAAGLDACRPGQSLAAVYHALAQAYRQAGQPQAIDEHHQGGVTGYQARELVATPDTGLVLEAGMAMAINPSFSGMKIEDTFVLQADGLENLSCDPAWPARLVQGRVRPLWLERQ